MRKNGTVFAPRGANSERRRAKVEYQVEFAAVKAALTVMFTANVCTALFFARTVEIRNTAHSTRRNSHIHIGNAGALIREPNSASSASSFVLYISSGAHFMAH
jgi:hypothetical protein